MKRPSKEACVGWTDHLIKGEAQALLFTEWVEVVCLEANIDNQS